MRCNLQTYSTRTRAAAAAIWRPESWASPHLRMWSSYTLLKLASAKVMRLWRSFLFSGFTSVIAKQVAFFLPTTAPRRALLFTMQYGTPRDLHRLGSHTTISIGSTSCAMSELRLSLLDEGSDMVEPHLHSSRLLRSSLATAGNFLSLLSQAFLFLGLRLWLKIVEKTEQLGSLTFVESVAELVDCRRYLDALQERHLAALQANVLGPLHEARQVTLGENIASDGECARFLLHSRAWELDPRRRRLCHLFHHCLT